MRINEQIRAKEVRLIDTESGDSLGLFEINEAQRIADSSNLDLIEVSPGVCKIMDYGKFKYQQSKRAKQPKPPKEKEVRINSTVGENDLVIKINRAKSFLDKGHPVKVVINQKARNINATISNIYERVVEIIGVPVSVERDRRRTSMKYEGRK